VPKTIWCILFCLTCASNSAAQSLTRGTLTPILGFENNTRSGVFPAGWQGTSAGIVTDNKIVHSGNYSARIERNVSSSGTFSTLTATIPLDFAGKTIQWRGFIKWANVNGFVALWLREDGASTTSLQFATLQGLNLGGTQDWVRYSISVPAVPRRKVSLFRFPGLGYGHRLG